MAVEITKSDYLQYLNRTINNQSLYIKTSQYPSILLSDFESGLIPHLPNITTDLYLYYKLNNDSSIGENNSNVVDARDLTKNGTVSWAVCSNISGIINDGSCQFNGVDGVIKTANQPNFDTYAISVWVKFNNAGEVEQGRIWTSLEDRIDIQPDGSLFKIMFKVDYGAGTDMVIYANKLNPNNWYHIFAQINNNTKIGELYINGNLVYNATGIGQHNGIGGTWAIGNYYASDIRAFNGTIDEFRFYNRTLSLSEIQKLYTDSSIYFTDKGQDYINITNVSSESVYGGHSLQWNYSINTGASWWKINFLNITIINYSGIGMWIKGDKSNNNLHWAIYDDKNNSYNGSGIYVQNYVLNFDEWRYLYIDFHYFNEWAEDNNFNINSIQLNVDYNGDEVNKSGTLYIDNIEFIDNYLGIMGYNYPNYANSKWRYIADANIWRYMDSIYFQSWFYNLTSNQVYLNNTINAGDMLVRSQDARGLWIETQGESGNGFWIETTPCTSLGLALLNIIHNDRINENITLNSWFNNNSNNNKTRLEHWNNTINNCASKIYTNQLPKKTDSIYVSNQYLMAVIFESIAYNVTGNISYLIDANSKLREIYDNMDYGSILPEKDSILDVSPYYDSGYSAIQQNTFVLGYILTGNNTYLDLMNKSQDYVYNFIGYNNKLTYANSTRRTNGDFYLADGMMPTAIYNISLINNNSIISQGTYLSILNYSNTLLTGNAGTISYLFPWGMFLPFGYDYYSNIESNNIIFPQQYGNVTYKLLDNNGNYVRLKNGINVINTSNFTRYTNEYPLIVFAINSSNDFWSITNPKIYENDLLRYIDEDINVSITDKVSLTGTSTLKTITSSLSDTISSDIILDVNCDSVRPIEGDVNTLTYGSTLYYWNQLSCSNDKVTLSEDIPSGTTDIVITYMTAATASCTTMGDKLGDISDYIGLIILGIIIVTLYPIMSGKSLNVNMEYDYRVVLLIGSVVLFTVVVIIALSKMCI